MFTVLGGDTVTAGDDSDKDEQVSEAQADYSTGQIGGATLGERIRYLLDRTGKTELSRMAGVSETQVYRYTTGENEPRASVLRRLVLGTGVAAGWLLNGSGKIYEDDHDYLLDLDEALLTQILATLDELTPTPQNQDDYRIRAEVAVATYRHALETIAEPAQRSEMVAGLIRNMAPWLKGGDD